MLFRGQRGSNVSQRSSLLAFLTADCAANAREAVIELEKLRLHRPELERLAFLHAELIAALFHSQPVLASHSYGGLSEHLVGSTPLFRVRAPDVDPELLLSHWNLTCKILSKHRDRAEPERLCRAATTGAISLTETLLTTLERGPSEYCAWLGRNGFDAQFGTSVLRLAALPILAPLAAPFQSSWHKMGWTHGYCPACGSLPILAELRGLEQFRWLRCGLCGSGWHVDRMLCPFCQSRNHHDLCDLFVEGEEQRQRLCLCDRCRRFLKTVTTLNELSVPHLLVMDLATLHLELVANERGYSVPSGDEIER
jgi:FdhE protein